MKLYDFFSNDPKAKNVTGSNNVAGYIDGEKFKYYVSDNLLAPATVNALQDKPARSNATLYTNREETLWVKDYPGIKIKGASKLLSNEGDGAKEVKPELQNAEKWPKQIITGLDLDAPLPGGGLYAAAAAAKKDLVLTEESRAKGLTRALRYYMLAAYSLIDISAAEGYEGLNNYVGALLVSDQGKILAAGINTGSFRHAETSMLLSYFRKNPTATKIPESTVIFSTLTPCKGCTGYLNAAKSVNCRIYFGQEDTGKLGKAGAKISSQLSSRTKEPLGRSKAPLTGSTPNGADDGAETGGEGVAVPVATSSIYKVTIDEGLKSCISGGSIATQVGTAGDSRQILTSASDALVHKMLKDRTGDEEQKVKMAVLRYIGQWLGTTKLTA
jgi:tRNA(Arg) A34 adenosine deaminase TadA